MADNPKIPKKPKVAIKERREDFIDLILRTGTRQVNLKCFIKPKERGSNSSPKLVCDVVEEEE